MANELTIGVIFSYEDSDGATFEVPSTLQDLQASSSGKKFIHHTQSIGTSEEALVLGEVTSLGWACFMNWDSTNYVEIRSATGAANDIIKVPPGLPAFHHFGSDVTAPYAIANSAACKLEYWIVSQ